MPKYDKMPKVNMPKWHFAQSWQNAQVNKMPKRHLAQDDNMPKKSFCPRWQIAQIVLMTKCWYIGHTDYWYLLVIDKGANRGWRNQPVPVQGFKTFCYGTLNICSEIRVGAKNNQWHGTLALDRWAPLVFDLSINLYAQGYKIAQKFFFS